MYKYFFVALLSLHTILTHSQSTLQVKIQDAKSNIVLAGATVTVVKLNRSIAADTAGIALFNNLTAGIFTVTVSHTGYAAQQQQITVAANTTNEITFYLEEEEETEEEVVVQSTRTSRTIKNAPARVEVISGEELDEKNNMRPSNVSMLLHESTGLQVQQTSATTGNASIRVQGLDGRYTQLLKDGYPNFGNFAGGLSVLEIPPLDLKQVEVIKGPASTLYGGGAIAGVVNFISKTPQQKFNGDFILNQSNIGQSNAAAFISNKKNKIGYTLLAAVNFSKSYDVDNDDFSEIPDAENFTIHPKLFFYPNAALQISIGNSFTKSNFTGGDVHVIKNKPLAGHEYFEKNSTKRNTSTFEVEKKIGANKTLKLKQAISFFNRTISTPGFTFGGKNSNIFTDVSYTTEKNRHTVIAGINLLKDKFTQQQNSPGINQNASSFTAGFYLQHTADIGENIKVESGLRTDNVSYQNINFKKNQTFVLPRVSLLFKLNNKISSRIGAGLGYKAPTVFTEQTEALQYKNVLALSNVTAEKSTGATADVNYRHKIAEDLLFSINQMFFITQINKPLVLNFNGTAANYFFTNAAKPVISNGFETNVKLIYKEDLKFFIGYTFTNAVARYKTANQFLPLLPKHKLNLTLMYEKEDNFKLGLEGYNTGSQYLNNGNTTAAFWEYGFMAQKTFNKISVFINFENFTDQRQSKYKGVANPPYNTPTFDEIWNHTEGRVINGGVKIKL